MAGRAFHDGVLDALREVTGWQPESADVVVGTSAGSIVGAWLRADGARHPVVPSVAPAAALRLPVPVSVLAATLRNPLRARVGVLATSVVPAGRMPHYMQERLAERFGQTWPDDPLWLVAARRRDGRRTVFGRAGAPATDVASAVAASCAVPGVFRPMVIGGQAYIDGGVHSPTNADLLAGESLDLVIVSSPMSAARVGLGREAGPRWMWHRMLQGEVRALRRGGATVFVIEPDATVLGHLGLGVTDPGNTDEITEAARVMAAEQLRRAGLVIPAAG